MVISTRLANSSKILLFIFVLFSLCFTSETAFSRDIIVGEGGIYTIRSAVEYSLDGDRIIVKGGYYWEGDIVIDKEISLIGEGNPVIDCNMKSRGIVVKKNNVVVKGFVIKNIASSNLDELAAIKIYNANNCKLEYNRIENGFFGIYLSNAKNCIVRNNDILGNAKTESSSGNGIHLWRCDSITVESNSVSGHRDGIYFEFAGNSKIVKNISFLNIRYGLHFMFSHGNLYAENVFRNNGAGVAVMYTNHVEMYNNRFEENWGASSYGILLKDINDSRIYGNYFSKNTIALFVEGSNRIDVKDNDFINNGWAVKLMGNCYDDEIRSNNFIGNTFDIATNSSKNLNRFYGNYWDKYTGYDLDRDGYGDVPFRPVSIYSILTEKVPSGKILMRSFVMNILDVAEKVFPALIPESLIDDKPLMKKIEK